MKRIFLYFALPLYILNAQDDLLDLIIEKEPIENPVYATFKASRIVNAQSIELPRPKTLEFMILHRFGSMSNGFYDLFGTDEAVVRYDLKYGFNRSNKDGSIHLHARKIKFTHPVSKELISITSPPPIDPIWDACL